MSAELLDSSTSSTRAAPRTFYGASAEAWALIVAMPLAQVANMAITVVVAPLREGLAMTYSELGLVLASFGLARLLMDLPAGSLVQRINPRHVVLVALAAGLISALIGCFAQTGWQVGLARVIHGGSSAAVQTAILAWLMGRAGAHGRGRVMALSEALFSVVSLTVPAAVGILASLLSWRAAFVVGLIGSSAAAAVVLLWTRPGSAALATSDSSQPGAARRAGSAGWRDLRVGGSTLLSAILVTFLVFFSRHAVTQVLLPLLGAESIGLSSVEIGLAMSLYSCVTIAAILGGGWIGDRVGRARLVIPGVIVMLVGQLAMLLIIDRTSYFLLTALLGVGFVLSFLPVALIGDSLPPPLRARGIGLYRLVADGAILLAPLSVGLVVDLGGYQSGKLEVIAVTVIILVTITSPLGRARRS